MFYHHGLLDEVANSTPPLNLGSLSFIGANSGTNNANPVAHQAGDLILVYASRSGNTTAPSLPTGYTSILTKTGGAGANAVSVRLGYKFASATNDVSGTWTNATGTISFVYRSTSNNIVLSGSSFNSANGNTSALSVPAIANMFEASNTSWVVGFVSSNTATAIANTPSGMTSRTHSTTGTGRVAGFDTNGPVSSFAAHSLTGAAATWVGVSVEITDGTQTSGAFDVRNSVASGVGGATLSNNDLTITQFSVNAHGQYSTDTISVKSYLEFQGNFADGNSGIFFAANGTSTYVQWYPANGAAISSDLNPAGTVGVLSSIANGHVLACAVDPVNGLVWFKDLTANSSWNANTSADPASNVGGIPYTPTTNTRFAYGFSPTAAGTTMTVNSGRSPFTGAVPSGFVPFYNTNPAVDFNFANGSYIGVGLGDLTVNNALGGYVTNLDGTLTMIGPNTPRIGVGTGLLVEDSATNFLLQSNYGGTFSGDPWFSQGLGALGSNTTAPDGTNTVVEIPENSTANTVHAATQIYTKGAANTVFGASVYVKRGAGSRNVEMDISDLAQTDGVYVDFSFDAGTVTDAGTFGTGWTQISAGSEQLANGWYRVWVTGISDANTSILHSVYGLDDNDSVFYDGDGTSTIYRWGAQLEGGTTPSTMITSYIPTTTAIVTRPVDQVLLSSNVSSIVSANAGTAVVVGSGSFSNAAFVSVVDGLANTDPLYFNANDPTQALTFGNPTETIANFPPTGDVTKPTAFGLAWNSTTQSIVVNQGTVSMTAGSRSSDSQYHLGSESVTGNNYDGYIRRFSLWLQRMADATLQTLTFPPFPLAMTQPVPAANSSAGFASGSGSASATGSAKSSGSAFASGVGSAQATGKSTASSPGSSVGSGSAHANGSSKGLMVASSQGSGSAQANGSSHSAAIAAASGSGSAQANGSSTASSPGSASGSSTATSVGSSDFIAVGSSSGSGSIQANGTGGTITIGSSSGSASTTSVGSSLFTGSGDASGSASPDSGGESTASSPGSSDGEAIVAGFTLQFNAAAGSSAGAGDAEANSEVLVSADGLASGTSDAESQGSSLFEAVGSSSGSGDAHSTSAASTGSASGNSSASSPGFALFTGLGTSSGSGSMESIPAETGGASGASVVSATGSSLFTATGSTSGSGSAHGQRGDLASGTSVGSGFILGVGRSLASAAGSSAGSSGAQSSGSADFTGIGSAFGIGGALASAAKLSLAAGIAHGAAMVGAAGLAIAVAVGQAIGRAVAFARGLGTDFPQKTADVTVSGPGSSRVPINRGSASVSVNSGHNSVGVKPAGKSEVVVSGPSSSRV